MKINKEQISDSNKSDLDSHKNHFNFLADSLTKKGVDVESIVTRLADFQVAIPSWALGEEVRVLDVFHFMESLQIWSKKLRMLV